jgi:hypothetical protein
MQEPVPATFDWVNARAKCSLQEVFKELEHGAREDVEIAQSLVSIQDNIKFSVTKTTSRRFSVNRVDDPFVGLMRSVDFACEQGTITAYNDKDEVIVKGNLTLTDRGHCKLKVGDEELFPWQFRRTALEQLFFGPFSPKQ